MNRLLYYLLDGRIVYAFVLVGLIQLYPVAVSDGQSLLQQIHSNNVVPAEYEIHGLDLSHHNKDVNWDTLSTSPNVHKKVYFCFIKATEGGDFVDKKFREYWKEARRVGISIGAYHFYRPQTDPRLQAQNFIKNVDLQPGDFAPVLDFEIQGPKAHRQQLTENVKIWLDIIEEYYGIKPIIYTNRVVYEKYVKGKLTGYPLWVSQYDTDTLVGFEDAKVLFWQHSQTGKTHGINGDVDFNVYLGSYLDMFSIKLRRRLPKETPAVAAN